MNPDPGLRIQLDPPGRTTMREPIEPDRAARVKRQRSVATLAYPVTSVFPVAPTSNAVNTPHRCPRRVSGNSPDRRSAYGQANRVSPSRSPSDLRSGRRSVHRPDAACEQDLAQALPRRLACCNSIGSSRCVLVLLRGRIAIRAEPHEPPERASAGVSKYGVVYLARDCVLNRDVAIKCVSSKRDRSRHPPTARPGSPLRRRPRPPIDLSRLRSVLE